MALGAQTRLGAPALVRVPEVSGCVPCRVPTAASAARPPPAWFLSVSVSICHDWATSTQSDFFLSTFLGLTGCDHSLRIYCT